MNKLEVLGLLGFILVICTFLGVSFYLKDKMDLEKAKVGLEECPLNPTTQKTIWVRSCSEYTQMRKENGN